MPAPTFKPASSACDVHQTLTGAGAFGAVAEGAIVVLFAMAVFVGAFLLFAVEPLAGRYVLPWFGGTPAVWTTCMLFFQALLLAGYAYARGCLRWLGPRGQSLAHLVLLGAALACLPVVPSWKPAPGQNPTWQLILLLARAVGVPFFVLAASGPLLQAWLARTTGRPPYRLFALSNLGSLLALLLYPLVAEPLLTRRVQASAWSWGLGAFALLCAAASVQAWLAPSAGAPAAESSRPVMPRMPSAVDRLLWVLLPCCASGLLLAVTNTLCQDLAVVPFLWVLPLVVYLLSFVLAFDSPRWYRRRATAGGLLVCLGLLCLISLGHPVGLVAQIMLHTACLLAACLICHGELARLKPGPSLLGPYYFSLAAGGAMGGVLVALAAPLLFTTFIELQLFLLACAVLLVFCVWREGRLARDRWVATSPFLALLFLLAALCPPLFGQSVATSRNFYGTLKVMLGQDDDGLQLVQLYHGRVLHGTQYTDLAHRGEPTTYYQRKSGVGILLDHFRVSGGRRIGVVGLGAGTLAAYGQSADYFRFYEINPEVIRVSRTYFTYLTDCPSVIDIVPGDARLSLERDAPQRLDVLVLDAFSGDSIPTHLLTTEAIALYQRHLKADGVLAVNVTNQCLDLVPLMAKLGAGAALKSLQFSDRWSTWVLLTNNAAFLGSAEVRAASLPLGASAKTSVWTDDYCNLLQALKW